MCHVSVDYAELFLLKCAWSSSGAQADKMINQAAQIAGEDLYRVRLDLELFGDRFCASFVFTFLRIGFFFMLHQNQTKTAYVTTREKSILAS